MKETQNILYIALALLLAVLLINQIQIVGLQQATMQEQHERMPVTEMNLDAVEVQNIQSTAQGLASVYALQGLSSEQVAQKMIPTGTPAYGEVMGVSYDDPIGSLNTLARAYPALKADVHANHPEAYDRWLSLAASPKGISCEFCCGLEAQSVTAQGQDMCGCQHHPALQAVTLWLASNTDYSDAEILKEAYTWKTLFFPQDMVSLGAQIAGGDEEVLQLPSMVGGC